MKIRFSNLIWGSFLLLAAAFVLFNQFDGFVKIGIGSIIAVVLSAVCIVQCIADLNFAPLPIPAAVLYIIFQSPLGLPLIPKWTLILTAALTAIGLAVLFPQKNRYARVNGRWRNMRRGGQDMRTVTESGVNENNPVIGINFGTLSRHLYADSLETARLDCGFGELEVFFDQTSPSPNGAEVFLNCNCGEIKLYIPRQWYVIDRMNCTLGSVDMEKNFASPAENVPHVTLSGNVSLGSIKVRFV